MNDLIKLLRGRHIDGRSADEIMRLAADELDRLNGQALELCAELSGLRRENERLRGLLARVVPYLDRGMAALHRDIDAALGAAAQPEPCTHLDGDGRSAFAPDLFNHGPEACLLCGATAPTPPAQPPVVLASDIKCPCGLLYLKIDGGYVPVCDCASRETVTVPTDAAP